MSLRRVGQSLLVVGAVWVLLPPRVYGYVDPGTGSYILQLTLGGVLGGALVLRRFWRRVWERVWSVRQPPPKTPWGPRHGS